MKLGSLKQGRDGRLVVVSGDLAWCADATHLAPTLQAALDDWERVEPQLRLLATDLEHGVIPRDRFHERQADATADVRLAVAHAPYLRVLDQFAADGYDAIIAGHTHGGQVCLPGGRALTTNCDLEPTRARGLHRHPADSAPGDDGSSWLHVSAGLGTNPYVRFRVACRPEATLMTLVPAS